MCIYFIISLHLYFLFYTFHARLIYFPSARLLFQRRPCVCSAVSYANLQFPFTHIYIFSSSMFEIFTSVSLSRVCLPFFFFFGCFSIYLLVYLPVCLSRSLSPPVSLRGFIPLSFTSLVFSSVSLCLVVYLVLSLCLVLYFFFLPFLP